MALLRLDRQQFLDEYFDYNAGEHLAIIEPTGGGKTHLLYQLLGVAMEQNPDLTPCSFMPKPSDAATAAWAAALNLRETPSWPPRRKLFQGKPRGYVLWPPHPMNLSPEERREHVGAVLRVGLDAQYRDGDSISLIDDAHSAAVLMRLNPYVEEILVNGRANRAAAWTALQKPSGSQATGGITSFVYSSCKHMFLGRDTEKRNIRRFAEIGGGIDPDEIEHIVRNLRLYRIGRETISEKLYLDLRGPYKALIGP